MSLDTTALVIQLMLFGAALALLLVADRRMTSAAPERTVAGGRRPAPSRVGQVGEILLIAAWFGLMAGACQLLEAFVQRYWRGFFLFAGPAMVWMTPLAYATIFAALGASLAGIVLVSPRLVSPRTAFGLFAWLSVFSLLLPFGQLHWAAAAILGAGIALQVSRVMARRPAQWRAIMWKTGVAVSAVIVALTLGQRFLAGWAERSSRDALPVTRADAPNVLFVVLDTVRADHLSLYGYQRDTTPHLARWANDGATFDMALSASPWTLKSHATMFSGLYPSQIDGDFEHPVQVGVPMLAEIFRDRGYATGGFVANLLYTSAESGLARGFIHYDDYHPSARQVLLHSWITHIPLARQLALSRSPRAIVEALRQPSLTVDQRSFNNTTYERKPAEAITASFLAWQGAITGRPFFAFLNYFDAHQPYRNPPSDVAPFESGDPNLLDRYDREIAYMDREVGRLLDELERRGELSHTIVIVVGDHGEQFGEHGLDEHGNSLYLQLLRVPLVIRYPPRVPGNVRIASAVTLRDLAATVIELADPSDRPHIPGVSLATLWEGESEARRGSAILAEVERVIRPEPSQPVRYGPMRALFDGKFHFIRRGDGEEELYAYRSDAAEIENLRDTPDGQRELPRLRNLLSAALAR